MDSSGDEGLASVNLATPATYHRGGALTLPGLSLVHDGGRVLFDRADVSLRHGSVAGLVGTNGCGKTSLARLVAHKRLLGLPPSLVVEYLAASDDEEILASGAHASFADEDVGDTLRLKPMEYMELRMRQRSEQLLDDIAALESKLECVSGDDGDEADIEKISEELSELYDVQDALSEQVQKEMHHAIEELGLARYADRPLSALSSGWRYKCRLVAAFITHPDLLIIDEPSFLDDASTKWLENKITAAAKTNNAMVLLISHKETLLDALCDTILYINSANSTLTTYHCGYSTFRSTHKDQVQRATRTIAGTEKKHHEAEKSLKSLQHQLRGRERNLKATTAQHADQRFVKGKNKEAKQKADRSAASKLKQTKKQIHDLEETRRQARTEKVKQLHIDGLPVEGNVVSLVDVAVSYNGNESDLVFEYVDACMEANDRVLLKGPNGCGKSTLVKAILGELEPVQGSITRKGTFLYFPQTALSDLLQRHARVSACDYLGDELTETEARCRLGNFGLDRDLAVRPINTLSAGQRVRLWLAKENLTTPKPSLLVVDEISENVDIETRDSLIEVLSGFDAAALVVSHDPDFAARFQATKTWEVARYGLRETYADGK